MIIIIIIIIIINGVELYFLCFELLLLEVPFWRSARHGHCVQGSVLKFIFLFDPLGHDDFYVVESVNKLEQLGPSPICFWPQQ